MFKKLEERLRMLNKYEIYLKVQIKHLEMKTTMCEMKNILYGIYSKLVQEKMSVNLKP